MNGEISQRTSSSWTSLTVALMLAGYCVSFVSPVVYAAIAESLELTAAQAGYVAAFELLFNGLGNLAAALTARWFPPQRLALAAASVFIIANGLSILELTAAGIMMVRAVSGLGEGILIGFAALHVVRTRDPARTYAAVLFTGGAYAAVANPVLSHLVDSGASAWVFALFMAWGVFAIALITTLPPIARLSGSVLVDDKVTDVKLGLRGHVLLAAMALFLLPSLGLWPMMKLAGEYFDRGSATIALSLSLYSVTGLTVAFIMSIWGSHVKPQYGLIASIAMGLCGQSIVMMPTTQIVYLAGVMMFAASWNIFFPLIMRMFASVDPSGQLASIAMVVNTASYAAGAGLVAWMVDLGSFAVLPWFALSTAIGCTLMFSLQWFTTAKRGSAVVQ
jgi:predicted MFS family arabinose efflux permease